MQEVRRPIQHIKDAQEVLLLFRVHLFIWMKMIRRQMQQNQATEITYPKRMVTQPETNIPATNMNFAPICESCKINTIFTCSVFKERSKIFNIRYC